ncbi:MAG: leucine-rich repeat domain-containing protein [Bacilli bacterium]|nr:leucine-rich repeat domain-containing protein [Bacilli bacterium]
MKSKLLVSLAMLGLLLTGCGGGGGGSSSHTHTFSNEWTSDDLYHWHAATCEHREEVSDKALHSYGEPVIDKEATETEAGRQHVTCSICNHVAYTTIPKKQHTHKPGTPVEENRVEATCTADGSYDLVTYCTECQQEISREHKTIAKLNHNFSAPTYDWSDDYLYCEAKRICQNDQTHVETERVSSEYRVVTPASVGNTGLGRYTATFENSAFETQTHDVTLPAIELFEYVLNDDQQSYSIKQGPSGVSGDIVIPATYNDLPVTEIANGGFGGCDSLTSVVLPDSITTIGADAFYNCFSLASINIPTAVTAIYESAFQGCSALETIALPKDLVTLARRAFSGCSSLTSINIPNGVKEIGVETFSDCSALESITLPNALETIGKEAFMGCVALKSLYIPATVTSIGSGILKKSFSQSSETTFTLESLTVPFIGASKDDEETCFLKYFFGSDTYNNNHVRIPGTLTTVTVLEGCTRIGAHAFHQAYNLTTINLPSTIKFIGESAFYYCSALESISIPSGVTSIGEAAFSYCSALASIVIPESVTSIGKAAFNRCSSLATITLPSNLTYLGDGAFQWCQSLTSIVIPEKITSIGADLFYYDTKLESVSIPESITSIGGEAFYNCNRLSTISIPNGVTSIGDDAFEGCSNLSLTKYSRANYLGNDENPYLWLVKADSSFSSSDVINENCVGILKKAFIGCNNITSITIPSSVKSIATGAFYNCYNLKNIVIPDTVETIGKGILQQCSYLENITVPFIGDGTFKNQKFAYLFETTDTYQTKIPTALKTITISDNCTEIPDNAFEKITSVQHIYLPDTLKSIGTDAFKDCGALEYNEYGNGKYLGNEGNPYLALIGVVDKTVTSLDIKEGCKYLYDKALVGYSSLESLTIPEGITSISNNLLYDCTALTNISIPDSITSIGTSALDRATNLTFNEYDNCLYLGNSNNPRVVLVKAKNTSIDACDIDEGCKIIYRRAFYNCTNLASVSTHDGLLFIGNGAFNGCSKLSSISIPHTVTFLGSLAFYGCTKLIGTISNNAVYLGDETNPYLILYKAQNTNITSCNVNDGCRFIYAEAFKNCKSLITVTLPDTVTAIGQNAFEECTALTGVNLPEGITTIEADTFLNCTKLASITLPESLTYIGNRSFAGSGITSINIPESVDLIYDRAFSNCYALTSVTIPEKITVIYSSTFEGCSALKSVTLNENIVNIVERAFYGCSALETINYQGTCSMWGKVTLGENWHYRVPATKVLCSDGYMNI